MTLVPVELAPEAAPLPEPVDALIRDAAARIDRFVEARTDDPIFGFVPSDFAAVYRVLWTIRSRRLAPGDAFLEWGSGFGVVALLAASLGFEATGIEIEPALVAEARRLAADHGLPVEFHEGSFLPAGAEPLADRTEEFAWLDVDGESAYEEMGLDPDDFDVIFAYPWPGEEHVVVDLFDACAATGALLVTYEGVEAVRVQRKARRRLR